MAADRICLIVVWDDWYVDGLGFVQCMAINIPIVSNDDTTKYLYLFIYKLYYILTITLAAERNVLSSFEDNWYVDGLGFVQCMAIHIANRLKRR